MSREKEMRKRINNNCYYGHFENLVVAMFYDEDAEVRKRGLDEVLAILDKEEQQETEEETQPKKKRKTTRKTPVKPKKKVREFIRPKLNWKAAHYYDWIDDIPEDQKFMPPVFIGLTREQLQEAAHLGRASGLGLHKFMGNTQCVEREIKIQTQMSTQVKSPERREQESANLHWSIDRMPGWMDSKKDYIEHLDNEPQDQQQEVARRALTRSASSKAKKK